MPGIQVIIAGGTPNPFRTEEDETLCREEILSGRWRGRLVSELQRQLGITRAQIAGTPDMTRNAALRILSRLAAPVYVPPPACFDVPKELVDVMGDYSGRGLTRTYAEAEAVPMPSTMSAVCAAALIYGLFTNEIGVHVSWASKARRVDLQVAFLSDLHGLEDSDDPGQPVYLAWRGTHDDATGSSIETWDEWDLRKGAGPRYRIMQDAQFTGEVITGGVEWEDPEGEATTLEGEAYPWRHPDGEPFIPVSIFHRAPHAGLWDRMSGVELVQATLTVAVLWTHWGHLIKDCGWISVLLENLRAIGGESPNMEGTGDGVTTTAQPVNTVLSDPAAVNEVERVSPNDPTAVHLLPVRADPNAVAQGITVYEQGIWGQILPIDFSSTGGDPLVQLQAAIEEAIGGNIPAVRENDARILRYAASVARIFGKVPLPDVRASLAYRGEVAEELAAAKPKPPPVPVPEPQNPGEEPDEIEPDPEEDTPDA